MPCDDDGVFRDNSILPDACTELGRKLEDFAGNWGVSRCHAGDSID